MPASSSTSSPTVFLARAQGRGQRLAPRKLGAWLVACFTATSLSLSSLPAHATASLLAQDGPSDVDIAKAKGLYVQAEELASKGHHAEAIPLYEEAYQLVPGKHGFAYKVGISAFKVGDCAKAKEYFNHLITYGSDQAKLAQKIAEAKKTIKEIDKTKCDQPEQSKAPAAAAPSAQVAVEEDNPFAQPKQKSLAGTPAQAEDAVAKSKRRSAQTDKTMDAMKTYGLVGLGGAMVITGGVLLILARRNGRRLGDLAQPSETLKLYPEGDFACRNPDAPCPYRMSRNMRLFNVSGYGLIGLGILAVGGGAYFWMEKKKGRPRSSTEPQPGQAPAPGQPAQPAPPPTPPKAAPAVTWQIVPQWSGRSVGAFAHLRF